MNRTLYALHRWLSAIAFLQLAAWTISGSFFALIPIETVRGEFVPDAHSLPVAARDVVAPARALEQAATSGIGRPESLELRRTPAGQFWIAREAGRAVRIDAVSNLPAPVSREEAEATARRDQAGAPRAASAELLSVAGVEYRGKPLPAWRVELDDGRGTIVYVAAATGDVTARRNRLWRAYDFLWSLHIMDYGARESFNHTLIRAAALLAVATVLSGFVLWAIRAARWWRSRSAPERA